MPRRPAPPDDKFLRANLNDPDNQAALLRAYLDLKQTVENLSEKLAKADQQLSETRASQEEAVRQASDAGQKELAARTARLARLNDALKLVRWAAEWADKGASFLIGSRHSLGEVIARATADAEECRQVRYEKLSDSWVLVWGDGRPDSVYAVCPPGSDDTPAAASPRRRRPVAHR